jgi:hypothetical protein
MHDALSKEAPVAVPGAAPALAGVPTVAQEGSAGPWTALALRLEAAVQALHAGQPWLPGLFAVHARARALTAQQPDAALYRLLYHAGHATGHYAAHHALRCLVIGELAAAVLQWPQGRVDALGRAALTMNVAMWDLQNRLALRTGLPSTEERAVIEDHAAQGATRLAAAGLLDELAVGAVRLHRDNPEPQRSLAQLTEPQQIARLLRRLDIFCAKVSRRGARPPMSPVQAARQACLPDGREPDEIGAVLLKTLGLYPPGSWVALACGEMGLVVERGRRPTQPLVASVLNAAGTPLPEPLLRDTRALRYAVQRSVPGRKVQLQPPHEAVLALRARPLTSV